MGTLWNWVNKRKLSEEKKMVLFLFLNCIIYSLLGFALWLVIRQFALGTIDWAVCFTGYSGFFIGYLGGYIFLCRR